MTGAVVDNAAGRGVSMIDRRAEDRWIGTPVRKASLAMSGVVLASLGIHTGLLILAATFGDRAPPPLSQETTVELVQEPPPPKPRGGIKEAGKDGSQGTKKDAGAPETRKTENLEAAKLEVPTPALQKPTEPAPPKADPQKAASAKLPEPPPAESKAEPKLGEPEVAENKAALQSLKQELDSLKAEQEALKAEKPSPAADAEMQTVDTSMDATGAKGIGPIPPSFGAIQLPQLSEVEGEAVGYQQIVFGQLARTKGIRRHMGREGTAGIVFTIDDSGHLARVAIAHPSGDAALDDEAMRIVTGSAPFPKPPPGATRTISANFNFSHVSESAP